jgi:hypothetical protein
VITPEELRTLAAERQATLRREAAVAGLVRRRGARRPIRIVQSVPSRLAVAAASVLALIGTLRVEH